MEIKIGDTAIVIPERVTPFQESQITKALFLATEDAFNQVEERVRQLEGLHTLAATGGPRKPMGHQPLKARLSVLEEKVSNLTDNHQELAPAAAPAPETKMEDRPGMEWTFQCGGAVGSVPIRTLRELVDIFGTNDWDSILSLAEKLTGPAFPALLESDFLELRDYLMDRYPVTAWGHRASKAAVEVIEDLEAEKDDARGEVARLRSLPDRALNKSATRIITDLEKDNVALQERLAGESGRLKTLRAHAYRLQDFLMMHFRDRVETGTPVTDVAIEIINQLLGERDEQCRGNTVFQSRVGKAMNYLERMEGSKERDSLLKILRGERLVGVDIVPPPTGEDLYTHYASMEGNARTEGPGGQTLNGAVQDEPSLGDDSHKWKAAWRDQNTSVVEALKFMFREESRDVDTETLLMGIRDILDPAEKGGPLPVIKAGT